MCVKELTKNILIQFLQASSVDASSVAKSNPGSVVSIFIMYHLGSMKNMESICLCI